MSDGPRRELEDAKLHARMARVRRKMLVLSGKGGVGKSTVAVNLAVALALSGRDTGLLDVDFHGPSTPRIVGLDGRRLGAQADGTILPLETGTGLKVVSMGLLLGGASDAVIWRGPMKHGVIRQLLSDVAWGDLDHLVIDSPPGTGDEPLSVAQLAGDNASALIVTTPQDLATSDVRRSISFCKSLGLPIAGIVENMSGLTCPRCGEEIDLFGSGGGMRLAAETGVRFLGRIPLDPSVVDSCEKGKPFVEHCAQSPAARAFSEVVGKLCGDDNSGESGRPRQVKERNV